MRKLGVGTGFGAVAAIFAVLMLLPVSSAGSLAASAPAPQKLGGLHEAGVALPTDLFHPATAHVGPVEIRTLGTSPSASGPGARPAAPSARPVAAVSHPTSPQVLSSFAGLNQSASGGYLPPDTQIAQNGSYVFEIVNEEYRLTSTSGKTIYGSGTVQSIWGINSTNNVGDVQLLYDMMSKRWFVTADDFTTNVVYIGVSMTSSPLGSYWTYSYHVALGSAAQFMDQPVLGVTKSYIAIDTNQFNSTTLASLGTVVVIFNKAKLIKGTDVNQVFASTSLFSAHPARDLVTNGSGTDYLYVASTSSSSSATTLYVYEFSGAVGSITNRGYGFSIANTGVVPAATQAGTTTLIATGDSRVQSVSWSGAALWVAFGSACTPSGDATVRSCVRVDEVSTATMFLNQDTDTGVAGLYLFYGALTGLLGGAGFLMVLGYCGALTYPSVAITGQNTSDNFGTYRGPVPAFSGSSYDTTSRFGDYSGIQLTPGASTKAVAWGATEYDTTAGWATETVHFAFY